MEDLTHIDHTEEFDCPQCFRARTLRWQSVEHFDGAEYWGAWVLACRYCGYVDYDSEHLEEEDEE